MSLRLLAQLFCRSMLTENTACHSFAAVGHLVDCPHCSNESIKFMVLPCVSQKQAVLHTIANKNTGAMLFFTPLVLIWIKVDYVLPVVCTVATFAAIQEGHYIRTRKTEEM